jgi:predicted O-methyltransferase YrrM
MADEHTSRNPIPPAQLSIGGDAPPEVPSLVNKCQAVADHNKFPLSSDLRTGALLRTLAASKPGGRILEIGSGVGVGAAWMLAGMDETARLVTVELREQIARVCRLLLSVDSRAEVVTADATQWLEQYPGPAFDLVFVDTTITKFERRDLLLRHMRAGALLVADDLLPQETWADTHPPRVARLRRDIFDEPDLVPTLLDWASGLLVAAYRPLSAADRPQR